MQNKILRTCLLLVQITCGIACGLLLVELTLTINPYLYHRAEFGGNVPLYAPMQNRAYDIHYSDGDAFSWSASLVVRPIDDKVEEHVQFQSDELGFANPAPIPDRVDMVVLGRSHSAGANTAQSWSRILESRLHIKVENLSQPSNEAWQKLAFLGTYGFPLHPRWVVFEIIAAYDLLRSPAPGMQSLKISRVAKPLFTEFLRKSSKLSNSIRDRISAQIDAGQNPLYPLNLTITGQSIPVVFYPPYVEATTVNASTLSDSRQWKQFRDYIGDLAAETKAHSACLLLLYAPMKPDVYLPLASPADLQPVLQTLHTFTLDESGNLVLQQMPVDVDRLQNNSASVRALVDEFAQSLAVPLVDPTLSFQHSVMAGESPFLLYDTHWNEHGHDLVAAEIASNIAAHPCEVP